MIPLALCCGLLALLFWIAQHYERHIRVYLKRTEPKVKLTRAQAKDICEACEMLLEVSDPQSDAYRVALDTKIYLERRMK